MADIFRGLITDEAVSKIRDLTNINGWVIAPFKFYLVSSQGDFSVSRTTATMQTSWYSNNFSGIEKKDNNKILVTIHLDGNEDTISHTINEIYITSKVSGTNADTEEFLYCLIQPVNTITFTPGVGIEMNFIITVTNTNVSDIYTIEYMDKDSLKNYQLKSEKGLSNGYCPLGSDGIVPDDYLPLKDNLPIGTIIPILCTENYQIKGYVPCDGSTYTAADYPSVWEYLTAEKPKLPTCSESAYNSDLVNYGSCAKFVVDTQNDVFKVPTIANGTFLQQANSVSELSKLYEAGIPNITGSITNNGHASFRSASGAFTATKTGRGSNRGDASDGGWFYFNASNVSNVYKDDVTTVQPKSVAVRYFILLSHGTIKEEPSKTEYDNLVEKIDLLMKTYTTGNVVTEKYAGTGDDGQYCWYRIYNDGWCEQGGLYKRTDTSTKWNQTITLKKKFASTKYTVFTNSTGLAGDKYGEHGNNVENITVSSFDYYYYTSASADGTNGFYWKAEGQLADGEWTDPTKIESGV